MVLGNRGNTSLKVPIKLEAAEIRSSIGTIAILSAANGLSGAGAVWDINESLTGDQIPSGANSHPFCLSFHLEIPPESALPADLVEPLILKVRVLASIESPPHDMIR